MRHLPEGLDAKRHCCATLDVAVTNPRAQQLYRRLGFAVDALRSSRLENQRGRAADGTKGPARRRVPVALAEQNAGIVSGIRPCRSP
jgi:ribosomal protein S18 acetylase RimI-like enzyme